jgi:hypothetical protein
MDHGPRGAWIVLLIGVLPPTCLFNCPYSDDFRGGLGAIVYTEEALFTEGACNSDLG